LDLREDSAYPVIRLPFPPDRDASESQNETIQNPQRHRNHYLLSLMPCTGIIPGVAIDTPMIYIINPLVILILLLKASAAWRQAE
jgi:hypothetical protein